MPDVRREHSATRLHDGRVLIAGGSISVGGCPQPEALYDPQTGTFSATSSMMTLCSNWQTATLLQDGQVLIAAAGQFEAELYDPTTGTFSPTGSQSILNGSKATLLPDGRVFIFGNSVAELYTP